MTDDGRRRREVDVAVVGGGPSGLAAATALAARGVAGVEVFEREHVAGGIPRHCHHTGFGIRDLHRVLSGPAYAQRIVSAARDAGARVRTGVSVTGWSAVNREEPIALDVTGPDGLERVTARAVVLATGARERPRPARWVPGDRPDGVYTTGLLQQLVYEQRLPVGRRAVIVGAEHVSFSAVLTLRHAGVDVVAMVTDLARHQSFTGVGAAARTRYRFPILTGSTVNRIVGRGRVQGVEIREADGRVRLLDCDTVVFTGDWVADHELARLGGIDLDRRSSGPSVDTALRTGRAGVFAVGNLVHPVVTADLAAADGPAVTGAVMAWLDLSSPVPDSVPIVPAGPLAWIAPCRVPADRVAPPRGRFVLWARGFRRRPAIEVRQGTRILWSGRSARPLMPGRASFLPAGWLGAVHVPGPPVEVVVH